MTIEDISPGFNREIEAVDLYDQRVRQANNYPSHRLVECHCLSKDRYFSRVSYMTKIRTYILALQDELFGSSSGGVHIQPAGGPSARGFINHRSYILI